METQDQNKNKTAVPVFIGCMFLGMGLGMYFGKMTVGIMIGVGIGFVASAIARAKL